MAPKKAAKKAEAETKAEAKVDAKAKAKVASKKTEEPKAEVEAEQPAKRKAEDAATDDMAAAQEPPKKESKVEEQVEREKDAGPEKRKVLDSPVGFNLDDTTLNVVPTMGGKVLASLSDGGLQYLIAGARANVGMKAGRYFYEVKIAEVLPLQEQGMGRKGGGLSKALLRVGFSTAGSPLVLGASEEHVYFDGEGGAFVGGKRCATFRRFVREQTIGVLLNLDPKSENKNTVSCFIDGVRVVQPQPLPEALEGKALFPHVSFRNIKVMAHFGPTPVKDLPFVCRTFNGAADADLVKSPQTKSKDGKFEVLLPVGFPDEGTFDWLDTFLEKHPHYVELSDRKIIEWALSSGLTKPKAYRSNNDKPEFNFGLPGMDDGGVRRIISSIAALMPRNYVLMEVRGNLLEGERRESLKRFSAPCFKKIAHVVMGPPSADYKAREHAKLLRDKQAKADALWRIQKAEKKRKRDAARRIKEFAETRKKMQEEKKLKAEEAAKAKAKKEGDEKKEGEGSDEKKEDKEKAEGEAEDKADAMEVDAAGDKKEEDKKDDAEKADEPAAEEEEDDDEAEPPKVELTDEEKALNFAHRHNHDLNLRDYAHAFVKFSIPEKSEGFDDIAFEWQKEKGAKAYLQEKVLQDKKRMRVEELQPGDWFRETQKAWSTKFSEWQEKLAAYQKTDAGKAHAAKQKTEEGKDDAAEKNMDEVDDVADVGQGEPLFRNFSHEDWALLQLRFELLIMQAAFKKDVQDADRPGVQEAHFPWYYNRYFKKYPNFKGYGVDGAPELVNLVKDTAAFVDDILVAKAETGPENFASLVKLCESARRERQRRLDAGDETARLKVGQDAMRAPANSGKHGGKKGGGKGNKKW